MKMKRVYIGLSFVAVVCLVIVVAVIFANHETAHAPAQLTCSSGQHANHQVVIKNNKLSELHTKGHYCDTLTIVNDDSESRLIAFGLHDHHQAYDGVTEKLLGKGQSLTVQLIQTGNFEFHDHLHDEVQGTFSVSK